MKSDLRIKHIPSKKLKWILTAAALYSASNCPRMTIVSTCSKTDCLRIFVGVWNRFFSAKIAYNTSVNNVYLFNTKIELT